MNWGERGKAIKQLYREGKTYQEIGNIIGVSKQRIHQIITGYQSPFSSKQILERRARGEEKKKKIEKQIQSLIEQKLKDYK